MDTERRIYELLAANDAEWQAPESYIKIYQTETQPQQEGQDNQAFLRIMTMPTIKEYEELTDAGPGLTDKEFNDLKQFAIDNQSR